MPSYIGGFQAYKAYSEWEILMNREIVPNYRLTKVLGFSLERIRDLDRTKAKIVHDGCINIVKWHPSGQGFLSGSDDREIKYWSLTHDVESVVLKKTIRTRHRSNIFYVDFDPLDPEVFYSCAADGTLRSNHATQRNVGELLRSSDDMIHMFHIDQDQPKVIYTAEESSGIYRIDLRTGQSEKIFHHGTQVYRAFSRTNPFFKSVPQWSEPGSVKAIIQNHTYSTPHLVVGGQGYAVGLLDLRLASSSEMRMSDSRSGGQTTAAPINSFVKLWSPLFPMNTLDRDHENIYQAFQQSTLTHPYGLSTKHPTSELKDSVRKVEGIRAHRLASISGLDMAKNGKRFVASFQNDQIYTFDFYDDNDHHCIGCRSIIGGHANHATFLKSVNFFGQRDEFVVAGSDTGHMWIWTSSPRSVPGMRVRDGNHDHWLDAITCPVLNILKADTRTCNGAAPHPNELMLVSYGIDSTAKLWAVRDPDRDIIGSDGEKVTVANRRYQLCRHEGPRDRSRYTRLSLAQSLTSSRIRSPYCSLASLPHLLEETKKSIGIVLPDFLERPEVKNIVVFAWDYVSTALILRQCKVGLDVVLPAKGHERFQEYFQQDYGAYMPSDALHLSLRQSVSAKMMADYVFLTVKHWLPWQSKPNAFWHRLLRRFWIIAEMRTSTLVGQSMDYFSYFPFRGLDKQRSKLFNFLFLPVLDLCRTAEEAKTIGSRAFRNKDYAHAHYFYCKAQRYVEYVLQLRLVKSLSSMAVRDNVPLEMWTKLSHEERLRRLPRPLYDLHAPQLKKSPFSTMDSLNRRQRLQMAAELERLGIPVDRDRLRLGPTASAPASSAATAAATVVPTAPGGSGSGSVGGENDNTVTSASAGEQPSSSASSASSASASSGGAMDTDSVPSSAGSNAESSEASASAGSASDTVWSTASSSAVDADADADADDDEEAMDDEDDDEDDDEEEDDDDLGLLRGDSDDVDDDVAAGLRIAASQMMNGGDAHAFLRAHPEAAPTVRELLRRYNHVFDGDGSGDDDDNTTNNSGRLVLGRNAAALAMDRAASALFEQRLSPAAAARAAAVAAAAVASASSSSSDRPRRRVRRPRAATAAPAATATSAGETAGDATGRRKAAEDPPVTNQDSEIDDNALQGNIARFFAPEFGLERKDVILAKQDRRRRRHMRCISRRYWRKVTLHPQGPHRLVRSETSPVSSELESSDADNDNDSDGGDDRFVNENDGDGENAWLGKRNARGEQAATTTTATTATTKDAAAHEAEADTEGDAGADGDADDEGDVAVTVSRRENNNDDDDAAEPCCQCGGARPPPTELLPPLREIAVSDEAGRRIVMATDTPSVGVSEAAGTAADSTSSTTVAETAASIPAPPVSLRERLQALTVHPDDAENDALVLQDDCKQWFRGISLYDPETRKKLRSQWRHRREQRRERANRPPPAAAAAATTSETSVAGDGDAGGSTAGEVGPAEEGSTQPVVVDGAPAQPAPAASESVPAALVMPATEVDRDALIDDEDRHDAKKPRVHSPSFTPPGSSPLRLVRAILPDTIDEETKDDVDADADADAKDHSLDADIDPSTTTAIKFESTEDYLRWDIRPEMGEHLHREAYALMTYVYDTHLVELMLTIYSNLAATFIAMEKYQDGLYVCEDAFHFARILGLEAARIDVKLYFRRGTCAMHLHLYEQAIHYFQEAATLQPKDTVIAKKLQEAKRALEQQRKREMRAYSRMFGGDETGPATL